MPANAVTQEINGVKPGFVVPVLIAKPETVPPFVRTKKYIDLNRLPSEWLLEFKGSIVGISALVLPDAPTNLRVDVTPGDGPHGIKLWFRSEYFTEEVPWTVQTSRPVVAERHFFVPHQAVLTQVRTMCDENGAGISIGSPHVPAGTAFVYALTFTEPVSPDVVTGFGPWDLERQDGLIPM